MGCSLDAQRDKLRKYAAYKEGSYLLLCCKISPKFGQNQQSEKETRFYLDTQQRIWYCNHA